MKQFLIILVLIPLLIACGKSREEKAAIFAEQEVKKHLYYPDTYESVEVKVDSAFYNFAMDPEAWRAASRIRELNSKIENAMSRYNSSKTSIAIWSGSYMSSFAKEEVRQAKEEMDEIEKEVADWNDEIARNREIIKNKKDEITDRNFCGWMIVHRFRCGNSAGIKEIYDYMLVADPKFKNLIFEISLDEGSKDIQNIEVLRNILEEE